MEIPGSVSAPASSAITPETVDTNTNSNQSSSRQVENNSDDPLAAIMNQTIFGGSNIKFKHSFERFSIFYIPGDSMNTMFIQVNTNSFLSTQNSNITTNNANVGKDMAKAGKEGEGVTVSSGGPGAEDIPITPDDDDLNTSYSCDICSKPVKGKVMLQVKYFCLRWISSVRIVNVQNETLLRPTNSKSIMKTRSLKRLPSPRTSSRAEFV